MTGTDWSDAALRGDQILAETDSAWTAQDAPGAPEMDETGPEINGKGDAADTGPMILTSAQFVAGFVPPDYVIDGILQRRFIYSMTAPTGAGKTAVALTIAAAIARGKPLGAIGVEKGRVLYLAGENADDVRMRWIAMSDHMEFDLDSIDVAFIPHTFNIEKLYDRVADEIRQSGEVAMAIVDTSTAYQQAAAKAGADENSNAEMHSHAKMLRTLTQLPGRPCVLVPCHPTKNASPDNMQPRGGGAFLNEVDGNLTCRKRDSVVELNHQGKFRGPEFAPVSFELSTVTSNRIRDSRDRRVPTVMAKALTETAKSKLESRSRTDEDSLILLMDDKPEASLAAIARELDWLDKHGKPATYKAQRIVTALRKARFTEKTRDRWKLTAKGKEEAAKIRKAETAATEPAPEAAQGEPETI